METLHIYAQSCWHDEAWIAGNREGLTRLRDAIDKALLDGKGNSDHVFTTDGEGYRVIAMKLTALRDKPRPSGRGGRQTMRRRSVLDQT